MITADDARDIARGVLAGMSNTEPIRLADDVVERPHHWVFVYNTVKYWETNDPFESLAGNGPIAVAKDDGTVTRLTSRQRIADQLP